MLYFEKNSSGIAFKVHVQPKASANQSAGAWQDALKIRLTAPPVDGQANKACIKFLSKQLKIPKSEIEIISGVSSRTKKILIHLPDDKTRSQRANQIQKQIQDLTAG
jgi:uncharacterized protein (TIGR00251 family)